MEEVETITQRRLDLWHQYHGFLYPLESNQIIRRPIVPADCHHNAHMYYILLKSLEHRTEVIDHLKENGVHAVFHYVPLHSSPAGKRFGRPCGSMKNTDHASDQLLRLPLWIGIQGLEDIVKIIARIFI